MPDLYAVVGNPIAQSKSPIIHGLFAAACGHDIVYERVLGTIGEFASTMVAFRAQGGRGVNVTAPFKLDAFAYATHPSDAAKTAGAVNAIKFEDDRVYAENFDGVGLVRDITINLATALRGKRVLVLGAGGATRGALTPLLDQSPVEIVVANRNVARAAQMVGEVAGTAAIATVGYDALARERFDVVLNATSASLVQALPPVPAHVFEGCALAYDLTYGKGLTPFLRFAKDNGVARCVDGVGMLVEQAAEAFLWWRGVRPSTRAAIEAISVPLV